MYFLIIKEYILAKVVTLWGARLHENVQDLETVLLVTCLSYACVAMSGSLLPLMVLTILV